MALFLNRDQIYRLLQRELPSGVYADGPPSAFFTTADMASIADGVSGLYANLERIYDNYFPATADESIDKWIAKMFVGVSFDTSVTLQDKRNRVIAKVRKQPTIALWEALTAAVAYVPPGKYVQILENCSGKGYWQLGVSRLGRETILGYNNKFVDLNINGSDWCGFVENLRGWKLGESHLGTDTYLAVHTYQQISEIQLTAYGYRLRVFDYAVTGTSYNQLIRTLNETEPARSVHIIYQNVPISEGHFTQVVTNVDQFSGVNCITIDPNSQTGYSGLK